ncbi:4Fe-4S dicluster domain-containing protein [Sinorhizobium medicae]|uniref:4Fe-4S dicluster domain-containing protein n=1 Tax=Sinorhizobium medicae TaxID=110321 RepID=UPI00036C2D04|nr:4Fe-4S dicluster domain-containing protein [Sinorhizobium medicae]WQO44074.1 4Fe-4S dicluster domain-containing protein [Sinorhizobium medicae]WQO66950.1 4Fe-4S dicluster domain-containing protein [Sinorhizobium medicae]WQO71224.1 4Fe-4S dicluster domain-containing protein [Sinorhizobium medicae]WQO90642.1 4Fe-4S dicluster domain-containing protein [Sinorhizobium medicae]
MTAPSASTSDVLEAIRAALAPHGLFLRGTVNFASRTAAPALEGGKPAASVVLIGNLGGSNWEPFSHWREGEPDGGGKDPLDTWSKQIISPVAAAARATAWFPSDPPWQPFQQWAMRAEGLKPSPLGILIHPRYGLWHGYRGALGFDREMPVTGEMAVGHPCETCTEKPCLSSCPPDALAGRMFDYGRCRAHLRSGEGEAGCLAHGCLSRNACPVGRDFRYAVRQLRFHMAALKP